MLRVEETWRLWCRFLDDYARFQDWLSGAELTAADPDSADVLYTGAKEELKKFEVSVRLTSRTCVSGPSESRCLRFPGTDPLIFRCSPPP